MLIAMTGIEMSKLKRGRRHQTFLWLDEACRRFQLDFKVALPSQLLSVRTLRHLMPLTHVHREIDDFRNVHRDTIDATVYDAMYLTDLKLHRVDYFRARQRLNKLGIPMFNPPLPNKAEVFSYIENQIADELSWIPRTKYQIDMPNIFMMLETGEKIWLKPALGSGGRDMLLIQKKNSLVYHVVGERFFEQHIDKHLTKKELFQLFQYAFRRKSYFAQQHIPLMRTKTNQIVDFRVTLQRDATGDWRTVSVTGRIGQLGANVTNYHAGGKALSFTKPSNQVKDLLNELQISQSDIKQVAHVAIKAANLLQKRFSLLGLLGIDVGRSVDGHLYVYDCNSRPGRDILTNDEIRVSMDCIAGYARYVIDNPLLNHDNELMMT